MSTLPRENPTVGATEPIRVVRPAAVIDIGTSSIRMAIAEIDSAGGVRTLETLSQAVNLGKDTFTKGSIEKATIEKCVEILKSYRQRLREYQISREDQIRVVATSAVREALNRLAFIDRVYIATGIQVEPIDEAEVNRITYLGVAPFLNAERSLAEAHTVVVEVGGGSTELLVVRNGDVIFSHTYRLGSLRLRQTLESYGAPAGKLRSIMQNQIERTVEEVVAQLPDEMPRALIALGGDMRYAASQLLSTWNADRLGKLRLSLLEGFTDKILNMSVDKLVKTHHLPYPEAETLGPALLAYLTLARSAKLDHVYISNVNLRDGLLQEMAHRGQWNEAFVNQIIRSAVELGRRFDFDEAHSMQVAHLCRQLFRALQDDHHLDPKYGVILYIAAVLHEIGLFIASASHHKHSLYIINNSEIFGLSRKDVRLVGLVARYHRRASPKPAHPGYALLDRESRVIVSKLAAILRVADALERSHSQRISEIRCKREPGRLVITVPKVDDLSLEQLALMQKGSFFEETFGMKVLLRKGRG
jgi:exopolyphosphatase / guanosine-5'-triphosphate,3'-diphosphate pyrophosphatase